MFFFLTNDFIRNFSSIDFLVGRLSRTHTDFNQSESESEENVKDEALRIFSPNSRGQQDVTVVLEIVNGAASQHDVC